MVDGEKPTSNRNSNEVPKEIREAFAVRLKAALRGDDEAVRDVAGVLEAEGDVQETTEEQIGFLAGVLGKVTDVAHSFWDTATSWTRLKTHINDSIQMVLIETLSLAFKTILTVPMGVKFTGDTMIVSAYKVKAVLYHLNGQEIPRDELEAMGEYAEEARGIAGYLTKLGLRAGLFALPGIGAIASATVGRFLEGKLTASFGDDPKLVDEMRSLIPK
ncbi:MAG: hypothetical protein QF752_09740 [Planctomycetota bacterium]|jgi:hypothetical protein|nr:hypothetical protein [Planctomycetota bacterium]